MNGFISPKALRFTLVASACLLSGFVSGTNFHGLNLEALFPKQEINYSKISWISSAFEANKIALATVDYPASDLENKEIKLAEFHMPERTFLAKRSDSKVKVHRQSNLQKLGELVAKIHSFDVFKDYRMASQNMQQRFLLAMTRPSPKSETVVIASSSAIQPAAPLEISEAVSEVVTKKIESNTPKPVEVITAPSIAKKSGNKKLNTQKVSIQNNVSVPEKEFSEGRIGIPIAQMDSTTRAERIPVIEVPQKVERVQSSAATSYSIGDENKRLADEALGKKLEEELVSQRLQTYIQSKAPKAPKYAVNAPKKVPEIVHTPPEDQVDHNNDVHNISAAERTAPTENACKILPKLHLINPGSGDGAGSIQICATQKTWISKSWADEGWAKVETESYFPLITYYPQMNSNKALLLDQNAVALLAIKSGVHFSREMGMILGVLPAGYRVEFSGRAEEIQYFDLNNTKYFVILNVEPGAGVTELISEKVANQKATVFTPVLSGTVTYLDLAAPISVNIPIKIVKGTEKNTQDVAGLNVSVSTQTEVYATTSSNGSALLKNVFMVPGYPVFVDVSSKFNGERSHQYRYQLNKRTRSGVFVLKQYTEKQIYQWFKQIKTNLSDQSGYIFGEFNRKRLDGFRNHYLVKVQSITETFGLNAKNYTILWDEKLSDQEPLEGDRPRFLSVQIPEGLTQAHLMNENNQIIQTSLIPVSPRVINVVSE